MKLKYIVCGLLAAGIASQSMASSIVDQRGYASCKDRFEREEASNGLVLQRSYLIHDDVRQTTYYINGSVWRNGDRQSVKATCVTDKVGRQVLSFETDMGAFVAKKEIGAIARR